VNLQVNLIRPQELRSASLVSPKSMAVIGSIVVPLALVLWLAWVFMGNLELKSELESMEQEKAGVMPQQKAARELKKRADAQAALYNEVMGWSRSRMEWSGLIDSIRARVPAQMQWQSLQMRQGFELDGKGNPFRACQILLSGRCAGPDADVHVEAMRRAWAVDPSASNRVTSADVTSYREDSSPTAGPDDRIFQIEVRFAPGRFDEAARK
jgi:Tfp pilus assembly protein PilN